MSRAAWIASTEGEVSLSAATAKTVLAVIVPANKEAVVVVHDFNFDGVTAAAEPVLVELMRGTTDGTGTTVTLRRKRGSPNATTALTAKKNYTAEPTGLTLIEDRAVDPYKGLFEKDGPLGREIHVGGATAAELFVVRLTAPAAVNVRAFAEVEADG